MNESGNCRFCNAYVMWVDTQNGRRMPLDREPERRYVIEAGKEPMLARQRNVYTCHLDTCKKRPK